MVQQSLESKKHAILRKLKEAGPSGAAKGGLGIRDTKSIGAKALKALEEEREIANLGTLKKTRYVLIEFYQPLELACDQVESTAKETRPSRPEILDLLLRKDLEKGCAGGIRDKVDEAIDWLVKQRKLLRFRRGRMTYYVHATRVKDLIPAEEGPLPQEVLVRPQVLNAYKRAKERLGYSNVEIYELQKELGVPMARVKTFLLEENRRGNAVLSLGDWSLSSEEIRSGAIELFGKPHLLVRFRDEG
jgi:hypothetical protein